MKLTALSFGGGVQTVALAILAAQERIPRPDVIVFADPGAELKETYAYIPVLNGWLARFGLIVETARAEKSLLDTLNEGKAVIPFYGSNGGVLPRICTERWKIRIVRRALRAKGARTADVMLGFSLDEMNRMKDSDVKWARNIFPLIDLRLTRRDCERIITGADLPLPPKSACYFCPFRGNWPAFKASHPEEFAAAAALEAGFDGLYLSKSRLPLATVVDEYPDLFDGECAGSCWT